MHHLKVASNELNLILYKNPYYTSGLQENVAQKAFLAHVAAYWRGSDNQILKTPDDWVKKYAHNALYVLKLWKAKLGLIKKTKVRRR